MQSGTYQYLELLKRIEKIFMVSSITGPSGASSAVDDIGVGTGPGPLRHPRALTVTDLHLQLEKEQEAVVSL